MLVRRTNSPIAVPPPPLHGLWGVHVHNVEKDAMESNSLLRTKAKYIYRERDTKWLIERRRRLIARLYVCEILLRRRGNELLPGPLLEALRVLSL